MTPLVTHEEIGGTMKMQHQRAPFSTISGTMVRLSARDTVAFYRRDDLSWVAHFRGGRGDLSNVATWFRANSGRFGPVAALQNVTMLTPAMIERIDQLHRQIEAKDERRGASSKAAVAAFARACGEI